MNPTKVVGRFFALLMVMVTFVTAAGVAMASDISNLTTTVTDLFTDLIPLIVILGIFGTIIAMLKLRGR